jgi:DNA-binding helix-hairpin-helix protein with protein kinase domain
LRSAGLSASEPVNERTDDDKTPAVAVPVALASQSTPVGNALPGLFTAAGTPLELGKELGRGGAGAVFEVPAEPSLVAKVYIKHPSPAKQSKLVFMASRSDVGLLEYTAWPRQVVHLGRNGPVVGFLMDRVAGREAIHDVYSPMHRRQDHPRRAWDFLVYTARNTAAAFQVLHAHGHMLGDADHGNVLVGANTQVRLIDCDSFQVDADGTLHLCEVGVAHFTPPELQGNTTFSQLPRTANHDNFGLALLLFQLLFGGRHPFAGVPLHDHVGAEIVDHIKAFRYAYARDFQARGLSPPPGSIPVAILPDAMETMFHIAFTEAGARGGRPTAAQWVSSLDGLLQQVTSCAASSMHRYPRHLNRCPWCELDSQGVAYFVDQDVVYSASTDSFVLEQVWAQIEAVPRPPPIQFPDIGELVRKATPAPLPRGTPGKRAYWCARVISFLFFIVASVAWPEGWVAMAILALIINWFMARHLKSKLEPQLLARQQQREAALQAYEEAKSRAQRAFGPDAFAALKSGLLADRQQLERLDIAETKELKKLKDMAKESQLTAHLERLFLDRANIEGLDPAKRAALAAYGIETASEVEYEVVRSIPGFSDAMTRTVCAWRKECEGDFRFDAAMAVPISEVNKVKLRFAAQRQPLQAKLISGVERLKRCSVPSSSYIDDEWYDIRDRARRLAQAEADLSLWS